jgi:hypothetical protein
MDKTQNIRASVPGDKGWCIVRGILYANGRICLCLILPLLFFGCASSAYRFEFMPMPKAEKELQVEIDSVTIKALDDSLLFNALQVTYPGHVLDVAFDPESELLLTKYSSEKDSARNPENGQFIMFSLKDNSIKWAGQGNPNIGFLGHGKALLKRGPLTIAYRANSGKFPKSILNIGEVYKNGTVLCMNDDEIRLFDLNKGLNRWEIDGKKSVEFYFPQSDEEWLYYIGDGLHGVQLSTGQDWYFNEPTRRSETGDIIVPTLLANAVAIPLGYVMIPTSRPKKIVHNLCSQPHIVGDSIFFAAADKVFCIKRTLGSALWETSLEKEYELYAGIGENIDRKKSLEKSGWQSFMGIWDAGDRIALVGMGYKYVDYIRRATAFPYIVLLNRATGKAEKVTALKEPECVMDFLYHSNNYYLMTTEHIYVFNGNLQLLNSINRMPEFGELISFLPTASNQVLIRYENYVVAFDRSFKALQWRSEINFFDFNRYHDKGASENAKKFYLESISLENAVGHTVELTGDSIWVNGAAERCLINISDNGRVLARLPLGMVSSCDGYRYGASGRNVLIYKEPVHQ